MWSPKLPCNTFYTAASIISSLFYSDVLFAKVKLQKNNTSGNILVCAFLDYKLGYTNKYRSQVFQFFLLQDMLERDI